MIRLAEDPSSSISRGSGEAIYGSFFTAYYSGLRQQRMNVWKFPTLFGAPINASDDSGGLGILRKNQHRYPITNSSGNMAVWKFAFAGAKADGTQDLFNIAFWDEMDGPGNWYTLTTSHRFVDRCRWSGYRDDPSLFQQYQADVHSS